MSALEQKLGVCGFNSVTKIDELKQSGGEEVFVDHFALSFPRPSWVAEELGELLVQNCFMPLLLGHGRPNSTPLPSNLTFLYANVEPTLLSLTGSKLNIPVVSIASRASWWTAVAEDILDNCVDAVVAPMSLFGRLYGDPLVFKPFIATDEDRKVKLIYPGSTWGLSNNADVAYLYWRRLLEFADSPAYRTMRIGFFLDIVSDFSRNAPDVLDGFRQLLMER